MSVFVQGKVCMNKNHKGRGLEFEMWCRHTEEKLEVVEGGVEMI